MEMDVVEVKRCEVATHQCLECAMRLLPFSLWIEALYPDYEIRRIGEMHDDAMKATQVYLWFNFSII